MRTVAVITAAAALLTAGVAIAQAPAGAWKSGALITTADGKRIGRVDRVVMDGAGAPQSVSLIYSDHFVHIPASTLSEKDGGLVTSLSRSDVGKLK